MRAYRRAEGTVMVLDDNENRLIEFEPVRDEDGNVIGKLPFHARQDVLDAINDCYSLFGWPNISLFYRIV